MDWLRWTSAGIGALLFLYGLIIVLTRRGPGRRGRAGGWFALDFGLALILFNVAGVLRDDRGWAIAATVTAAVCLALAWRNRPWEVNGAKS